MDQFKRCKKCKVRIHVDDMDLHDEECKVKFGFPWPPTPNPSQYPLGWPLERYSLNPPYNPYRIDWTSEPNTTFTGDSSGAE